MQVAWALDLHDYEGDVYEECVLLFAGENTILKFKSIADLECFADSIKSMLPEMRETALSRR